MAVLQSFKLTGRTSATTNGTATGIIADQAIDICSDNMLRWVDSSGRTRALEISGEFATLLQAMLTGAGGVTSAWFK